MKNQDQKSYILPFLAILALVAATLLLIEPATLPDNERLGHYSWREVSQLQVPRRALAAVVNNGYVYAIGGVDAAGRYVRDVEFAKIQNDGSLSAWQRTSALNQGRFYLAAASIRGHIYAIGGGAGELGDNNQPSAVVEKARVNADGSLGQWQFVASMSTPRRGLKVVSRNDSIYALGGYNGAFLKSVERATVNLFGEIDQWLPESEESIIDRYIHSAAISGNRIYLLGGHVRGQNKLSYGDVEKADILPDGSVSRWTVQQSRLTLPRFIASSLTLGSYLYLFGGHDGASRLKQVEFSLLADDGRSGHWNTTTPLLTARSAAAVVKYGRFVYVIGGMGDEGPLGKVEMAMQLENGHLGQAGQ